MGTITNAIDVKLAVDKLQLKNFVETGTGEGNTLYNILQYFPYGSNFYSIEFIEELYKQACEKFKHIKNMNLFQGYSHEQIKNVVAQLNTEPTLFWNDAHFPGADYGFTTYDSENDPVKRIPLEQELINIVESGRDISRDVFVLDDLRVYKDGNFQDGNWHLRSIAGGDNIDFVYRLFDETHMIFERNGDQGYVVIIPKGLSSLDYNRILR
jgi:hypothetical protein